MYWGYEIPIPIPFLKAPASGYVRILKPLLRDG